MGTEQAEKHAGKLAADESVGQYAKVFDYMLEGCQIIGPGYKYLYINSVAAQQGQSSKEALTGRTMMECYPGIDKTEMFDHLRSCMEKKEVHYMENEFRFPNGSIGWFELRMEPLPMDVVILSLDITERKKAQLRIEQLEEIKKVFIGMVSDQLRTPLSAMNRNLEDLRGAATGSFDMHDRVRLMTAHSAAAEVTSLLSDMTSAVGAAPGEKMLRKVRTAFDRIWESIYADCKSRCEMNGLKLVYAQPSAPYPDIECDPDKIKQVLIALVDNALRYTSSGRIAIAIDHRDGRIRFQVTDTGVGIPTPEQPQVFKALLPRSKSRAP